MDPILPDLLKDRIPEIQIDLKRVKIGTTLTFDLYNEYGNIIVEMNTPLSEPLLNDLKSNGIEFLYYNPAQSTARENVAGLDTAKNILDDEKQQESISVAKEILDSIKSTIDFSSKSITQDKVQKTYLHVDNILQHIENNSNSIFTPFTKLKNMDEYTYTHSSNVSILSAILGARLEFNRNVRIQMGVGGLFHDIGKVFIDEKILNKKDKLTAEEFTITKKHPQDGFNLVKESEYLGNLEKSIILFHHERPDTNGYPFRYDHGKFTGNVPKEVRLISICDVYSSLTMKTSYREAYSSQKALRHIIDSVYAPYKKKFQFLPSDVRDFIRSMGFLLNKGDYFLNKGEVIRLSTGEIAVIEEMNRLYPMNPKIKLITNKDLKPVDRNVHIDLLRDPSVYIANIMEKSAKTPGIVEKK